MKKQFKNWLILVMLGIAIIIGSEGFGMNRLVKENADILVKIPMKGNITSLNASVSAGIVIYEAVKQREL